jgi:hypothetical protein
LSGKNDQNALWPYRNSYNAKFRVVAVFKQPQRVVACEDMPLWEIRVVIVNGNDHNKFRLNENTTRPTKRIEKMKMKIKPMTLQKKQEMKDNTKFTV